MRFPDKLDSRDQPLSFRISLKREGKIILIFMKENVMDILFLSIAVGLFALSGLLIRLLEKV